MQNLFNQKKKLFITSTMQLNENCSITRSIRSEPCFHQHHVSHYRGRVVVRQVYRVRLLTVSLVHVFGCVFNGCSWFGFYHSQFQLKKLKSRVFFASPSKPTNIAFLWSEIKAYILRERKKAQMNTVVNNPM